MARPIVKYLDPISGEYEFATVVDVGDLRDLNTTIKSDIVGAINSIISDGVHNPINNEKIEDLERIINSLKDGTFKIDDFGSIDEYLKQQFLDELDKINEKNREEIQSVLTQLDTSVDDAIKDYQEKVAAQNIILENAENTLGDARDTLEAKAAELETANIGFSELETEFNELDNYISTNVRTIDFDNFNAMVEDYETVVTQTSDEVGVDMSGSTLSYLTGRVTDAEANISAQAGEISSKMGYNEFQYMPVPKYDYGENLLFDTFDFGDAWSGKNGAQVTPDTFLFGKVVAFNSPTGLYETLTDDLTIGESYVFSTYVNVQPSEKSPSQDRYEPISKSYDPTDFKIQIGGKSFNPGVYEDLSGINGWVRINQEFVADAVNPIISITPTGVNSQSEVAYMAMPKVEKGLTVTPWQPHVEDNYATISSTQSMIKQQANSITAFVTGVEELDDSYKQATSTFKMLADGFEANTEAVEAYEDAVTRYGTEYSNINGKFEQKVWKDDFKTVIEDINIDNRNRVLNSDFIRSEISSSDRRLIVEDWSLNSDWEIKTIDNDEYLSRNRTGLTQNLITSASSNYFPVRDGERILFGFDLIHSGLDDDKVFAIELFDISNKRLLKQEFSLSSLTKVGNRYHGSFSISTPGAEKGSVVLQLPRNGSVSFTKISFQNADIGSVDWSPAPEDSWIIQSKLATYISQVEDEITIGGVGQKVDTLTGLLTEDKGTFTLNPDKIATEVLNSQTYDDMGFVNKTNFEQTADGWMQEITSEGRLAGYINASPDTYRISFDKIMLEGTTWADALGSSKITVTDNFSLIGQNGKPVLNVSSDGSINMNVTSLNIGEYNALTTNDKSDIEKEVTDKVIKTTEPYIHIAYADTEKGAGLSFNPSGKQYIGFAKSHLPTPSGTASNYEWSKYVGDAGKDGVVGKDGVGLIGTNINYATSTSGTIRPNDWGDEVPTTQPGDYLWTKTTWYYSDNTSENGYSVSRIGKDGNTGKDGLAGKDGVGIAKTTITYAKSSSGTTAPKTGYKTTVPSANPGEFVWTKTVWTYTDNTTETGYSVGKIGNTGATGATGANGKDGVAGKDGVGIQKTEIHYASSTSGTTKPSSGWNLAVPTVSPGNYLWTRTTWTYTDKDVEEGYSVSRIGKDGNTGKDGIAGKDGVGITDTVITYAKSTSGITPPGTGWNSAIPTVAKGEYLWTRTVWDYSDNTSETGFSVARMGLDGSSGKDGTPGKDGVGLSETVIEYAISTSATTAPTSGYNTAVPTLVKGQYLWTRTRWTYSDNSTETGYSVAYIAKDGNNGKNGIPGKDGVGITDTVVEYAKSTNGTTAPAAGWVSKPPSGNPGDYIWTRTTWSYTDNTTEVGYSVGRIGTNGTSGKDGAPGKDGVGITDTIVEYGSSTSGTTKPTTWTTAVPTVAPGNYQWTRTTWIYTDGTSEIGYTNGRIGKDGNTGKDGIAGKDGVGIKSTVINYASSTSGTTKPTSGWTPTVPSVTPGNYLWTRTVWTYTDNDVETGYSVSRIGKDGKQGPQGPQGIQGPSGSNGQSQWVHIRYSANSNGSGMDTKPSSTTKYVGIAVTNSATAPAYTGFTWSKYVGENGSNGARGPQGVPGKNGANGKTTYTWVKYADTPTSGMNQYPDGKKYIGLAFNQTDQNESNNYNDYQWSLMPQNIDIGGRNLLRNSDKKVSNGTYNIARYDLTDKIKEGEEVTLTIWGSLAATKSYFSAYNSGGSVSVTNLTNNGNGTYSKTFKWKIGSSTNTYLNVYAFTNAQTGTSTINKIKLEKGNVTTDWTPAPEDVTASIKAAQDKANAASNSASAANNLLTDIASDSKLTATEKKATKKEWDIIVGEKPKIDSSADNYGITTQKTAYNTAYHTLNNYLSGLLANLNTTSNIVGTTFRANFKAYYNARQDLLNKIADGAKSLVDEIEIGGRNLIPQSNNFSGGYWGSEQEEDKAGYSSMKIVGGTTSYGPQITLEGNTQYVYSAYVLFDRDTTITNSTPLHRHFIGKGQTSSQSGLKSVKLLSSGTAKANVWNRIEILVETADYESVLMKTILYAIPTGTTSWWRNFQLEKGNKATDWTPAPEDIEQELANHQDQLDKTIDTDKLNTVVADINADKLSVESYESFLSSYEGTLDEVNRSIGDVATDIGKALSKTSIIETTLGEGAQDWLFTNTKIRMSDEGITLGDASSGTYLQISSERISFFAGATDEVAYVSGGMLYINKAIFVQSIQVAEYLISKELDGHLTYRFVGMV